MDSTSGVARIIHVCIVGLTLPDAGFVYETEKALEKVHPSHPARGQCSESGSGALRQHLFDA